MRSESRRRCRPCDQSACNGGWVSTEPSLPDQVRAGCEWVAAGARSVSIDEAAIAHYSVGIAVAEEDGSDSLLPEDDREQRAAFAVCLNAINFGSGWWPTIRKRPAMSGFSTIAAGLQGRFA